MKKLIKYLFSIFVFILTVFSICFSIDIYLIKDKDKNFFIRPNIRNYDQNYFYIVDSPSRERILIKMDEKLNLVNCTKINTIDIKFYIGSGLFTSYNQDFLYLVEPLSRDYYQKFSEDPNLAEEKPLFIIFKIGKQNLDIKKYIQ